MSNKVIFDLNTNPDDFVAIQLLGCGGFGQVFELFHIPTKKYYAGKLISESNEQVMKDINTEVGIMKSISGTYTVNFYGIIKYPKSNPHYMIITDYCDRGSIRDIMDYNETTLTENQISFVLHDLLKALSALHEKYKIIHRDIKSANILMSSDSTIKITDFGVSRQLEKTIHTVSVIGTLYWMAPEVILSTKYSFPADIWSVGVTAVELAEGAPPYFEFPATRAMKEIAANGFPGFRTKSKISADLQDFIYKCLAYKPEDRPKANELLNHPFIKKCEKLDRNDTFKNLLQNEINFIDLISDEDIESATKIVNFQVTPIFNKQTNIYEKKKTMCTFIRKAVPGEAINTIYISNVNVPTIIKS